MGYPETEAFAYGFARAELTIGRRIITAISNVQFGQPTTEGVVRGTQPFPLARTEGEMDIGSGVITFSDEAERVAVIDSLGDGYRAVIWNLKWVLTARGRPAVRLACQSCRFLDFPVDHGAGEEALGGEMPFSFLSHTVNGKAPHPGMPSILR